MNVSRYIDKVSKFICKVVIMIIISLFIVGGCSNNNNSNDTNTSGEPFHGVLLGAHNKEALPAINANLDVGEFEDALHNIILDGSRINLLTDEEIQTIRDAYNQGFIILLYDMSDDRLAFFYRDILDHPRLYEDVEGQDISVGDDHEVFSIEQHDGLEWTSQSNSIVAPSAELTTVDPVPSPAQREFNEFTLHAYHMRQWIEAQDARRLELVQDGLIEPAGLEEILAVAEIDNRASSTQEGTLLDLASAWIQTSQVHIGFTDSGDVVDSTTSSATDINTYQMTSKAWLVTSSTPTGLTSFLLVNQDFNLASTNGFQCDKSTQKAWYLSEWSNVNTLEVDGETLTVFDAQLTEEQPETNQATTTTETTSVSTSISGTVGADQTSGANASLSGGVSWSSSNTFSKADVSINNQSLSQTLFGNDASWQYLPRKAEKGPDDGCVNTIHNLADLSHETFTPSQAYIYSINGDFADMTLKLKTSVSTTITNTYVNDCNIFGCDCEAKDQDVERSEAQQVFTQSIHIPAPPEGPAGDDTCSDNMDNDNDGDVDGDDSSCQG